MAQIALEGLVAWALGYTASLMARALRNRVAASLIAIVTALTVVRCVIRLALEAGAWLAAHKPWWLTIVPPWMAR